jgi:LAGLIDADG endonuclease
MRSYPSIIFTISQNTHDVSVLKIIFILNNYFNCGNIYPNRIDNTLETAININSLSQFSVKRMFDIKNIIIPFFDKYPFKALDYADWKLLK